MINNSHDDVRNQFLRNADNTDHYEDKLRNIADENDDFNFTGNTSYQNDTSGVNMDNNHKRNRVSNSYELESFKEAETSSDHLYANRLDNPFGSNESNNERAPINPFRDAELPPLPYNAYNNDKEYPLLPQQPSEEERIRQNDMARAQQLRQKPRFHYTKLPYFTIVITIIQVVVFIVELVKMANLTGSAFQTQPYFNPMLGPSIYVLINMGARYVPCMQAVENVTNDISLLFPCPNSTSYSTNVCSLPELCGLSGIPLKDNAYEPHQWYRLIVPIFLHAGFLHIIFNLLLQIVMGASIERHIGFIKYFIIYLLSGIAGFLLGANFSPRGIASTGASGSLFGILATNIILFIYCGRKNTNLYGTKRYALFICIMIAEIVVSIVLGLLPGLDNFSHIGGFAMGILLSILLLPDPFFVYLDGIITYNAFDNTMQQFINNWNPLYHYEDKIPLRFYIWCGVRVVSLVLVIVYMALLIKSFFSNGILSKRSTCHWCKYINCIPVNGWCDLGEITIEETTSSSDSTSSYIPTSSSTSAATTTYPGSINNPNSGSGLKFRREYGSSSQHLGKRLDYGDSFIESQNIGIGFYILLAFLTYVFCKKKKIL